MATIAEIKNIKDPVKRLEACRLFVSIGRGTMGELGWARGEVRAILKAQREAAPKTKLDGTRAVISAALEPQRQGYIDFWVAKEREYIADVKRDLAGAGWDMNVLVADPYERGIDRHEKEHRHNQREYYGRPVAYDRERKQAVVDAYDAPFRAKESYEGYDHNYGSRFDFRKEDPAREETLLKQAAEAAGANFDAFINKMTLKTGEGVTGAALSGRIWTSCELTVEKPAGIEIWYTKMILNRSKLGTLYNQWPSRLVGGVK